MPAPSNLIIKIGMDTASLTTQKAVLQAQLKDLQSQMTATAKQFQAAGDSVDEFGNSIKANALAQLEALSPQVNAAKSSLASLTPAMNNVAHSSAGVRRELIVLGHEFATGNYSRLGGSLSVLAERMGGIGGGALAAAGGVAALGFALYELIDRQNELNNAVRSANGSLLISGSITASSTAETKAWIEELQNAYSISFSEATKSVDAIRSVGGAGADSQRDLLKLAEALHTLQPNEDFSKIAEEVAKAANGGAEALMKFVDQSHGLTEAQKQAIKPLIDAGNQTVALGKIIEAVNGNFADQARTVGAARHQLDLYKATLASITASGGGAYGEVPMLPDDIGVTAPKPDELEVKPQGPPRNQALEQEIAAVARLNPVLQQTAKAYEDIKIAQAAEDAGVAGAADAQAAAWKDLARIKSVSETDAHEKTLTDLRSELALSKENGAQRIAISKQIAAEESAFYGANSSEARTAAVEVARAQAEAQQKGVEDAKRAAEQKKTADREWFDDYGNGIKRQIAQAADNFAEQQRLAQAWVDAGKAIYGQDVRNYQAAIDEKARIDKEAADQRFELADKPLKTAFANQQRSSATQLSALGETDRQGILGSPEQEAQTARQIVATDLAALEQIEAQRKALAAQLYADDPTKAKEAAQEIADQFVEAQQAAADKIVEINAKAAEDVKKDWESVNSGIGDALAKGITSDKKGGFGEAITGYLREKLTSGLGDAITGGLGSIEKLIGLGGTSPGGLLSSGLNAIGLGGVGKFFGFGADAAGAAGAGGQAAATAGLTTAATTLTTAGAGIDTAAVGLNTAAVALNTAAVTLTAAAAAQAASGGAGAAADGLKLLDAFSLTPAAASGGPISGLTLVGEKGPELFQPGGSGQITSHANLMRALGGQSRFNFGNLTFSPPASLAAMSAGASGLSASNFSQSIDNSRRNTTHIAPKFTQQNAFHGTPQEDLASQIGQLSQRELGRLVRQGLNRR